MLPLAKKVILWQKFDLKLKGYVGGYDFDSNYVEYILEKSESKEVNVLIDSLGGSVASAFLSVRHSADMEMLKSIMSV